MGNQAVENSTEITRSLRDGLIIETVHAWHYRTQGPGEPGGREYSMIYASNGRVRIDVSGCWSSMYHTIFLSPEEIRPSQEWRDHLLATGQQPVVQRWCAIDGKEIPAGSDPELDDDCCSRECRNYLRTDY